MRISDWSSDVCSSDLPSELMKIAIVLALARFYAQLPLGNTRTLTALWQALDMIGVPAGLVLLQPDLGTALAICAGGAVHMFMSVLPLARKRVVQGQVCPYV